MEVFGESIIHSEWQEAFRGQMFDLSKKFLWTGNYSIKCSSIKDGNTFTASGGNFVNLTLNDAKNSKFAVRVLWKPHRYISGCVTAFREQLFFLFIELSWMQSLLVVNILECLEFGGVSDVSEAGVCLLEVSLDLREEWVFWRQHQCRMVAHLPQVLESLWEFQSLTNVV